MTRKKTTREKLKNLRFLPNVAKKNYLTARVAKPVPVKTEHVEKFSKPKKVFYNTSYRVSRGKVPFFLQQKQKEMLRKVASASNREVSTFFLKTTCMRKNYSDFSSKHQKLCRKVKDNKPPPSYWKLKQGGSTKTEYSPTNLPDKKLKKMYQKISKSSVFSDYKIESTHVLRKK